MERGEAVPPRGDCSEDGRMFTLNTIERHAVCCAVFDARGNGEGGVCPTITGDHENRITDYTAILCYNERRRCDYHIAEGASPTVTAKYGTGGGNTPIVIRRSEETHESISGRHGSVVREQPSGESHGAGRVQQYAPGVQEEQ